MGIWVKGLSLEPGERVVWEKLANRQQSELRAVGGCLSATTTRFVFQPNRVDALTKGRPWSVGYSDVTEIGVQERENDLPIAGRAAKLRRRLRIGTRSGVELFVVNGVEEVVARLHEVAGR